MMCAAGQHCEVGKHKWCPTVHEANRPPGMLLAVLLAARASSLVVPLYIARVLSIALHMCSVVLFHTHCLPDPPICHVWVPRGLLSGSLCIWSSYCFPNSISFLLLLAPQYCTSPLMR